MEDEQQIAAKHILQLFRQIGKPRKCGGMTVVTASVIRLSRRGADNGIGIGTEGDRRQVGCDFAAGIKPAVLFMYGAGRVLPQKRFECFHGLGFPSRKLGDRVQGVAKRNDRGKHGIGQ